MPPWSETSDGLRLRVRVTPNASADRIEGAETLSDGTCVLRLRVRAVPEGGKANAAVAQVLAKAVGLSRSAVTLIAGDTARLKTLHLAGDAGELAFRLAALARG